MSIDKALKHFYLQNLDLTGTTFKRSRGEVKTALYKTLADEALLVAAIKDLQNHEPGFVAHSFKAVPLSKLAELFGVEDV